MTTLRNLLSVKRVLLALGVFAVFGQSANVPVTLLRNAPGANISPARAKRTDRIIWASGGNNWRVEFTGRTPCQNGATVFSSAATGGGRICTISVVCTASDRRGCGRYKYTSTTDGGAPIDPEIEVVPDN